jgi:hypothetical protein
MFALPPKGDVHWVYDDPSGVPETPISVSQSTSLPKPKRGKVVRFPVPTTATPKAA